MRKCTRWQQQQQNKTWLKITGFFSVKLKALAYDLHKKWIALNQIRFDLQQKWTFKPD